MRPMWKGAISFGLVTIPIKLYTATESKAVRFNFLHDECKTPIRYEKKCPACDREIANDEIVRGYEYEKGRYVIVSEEDLEKLPLESAKAIQILDFVQLEEIDPIYFIKSYFIAPDELGVRAYGLLFRALSDTGKVAVCKIFLRSKEALATIRVYQNCLLLETMFFADEIRKPQLIPELAAEFQVDERELEMAKNLVENLTAEFEPAKYHSNYREALKELIQKKIADEDIEVPKDIAKDDKIVDLMEALKASIKSTEKKQKGRKKRRSVESS